MQTAKRCQSIFTGIAGGGPAIRVLFVLAAAVCPLFARVAIISDPSVTPREQYGIARLRDAVDALPAAPASARIVVGLRSSRIFASANLPSFPPGQAEAFRLRRAGDIWLVAGSDASGVLYGALELARRIRRDGALPAALDVADQPAFVLRGPCIGMQKTEITYDGAIYDYRYTPEDFPFFYDRAQWIRYLDFLSENRMNTLYLWNGHPFTSLLKLPKYPGAQELTDEQLNRNIETFKWLTAEADRRGIWLIQLFYNIHISHALANARGLPFHHGAPTPFTSEYTRDCISEFIRNYPNVGLLMTLGEALAPRFGPEWLTKTIIPGVRDGMRAAGLTNEPPIIVRAHATEIEEAIHQALPMYKNIYTMHKYNGESLTWTDFRGPVAQKHKSLVDLGSTHIANVHLLSNLEPFRWGSPDFIQKSLQSCRRHGIKGLHLYPLRYWEWPVSADNPPLKQIDRDWIWFEAWARYSWDPDRDRAAEVKYWTDRLSAKYGTPEAGAKILQAYELSGTCAPRLLPRIGITEGNRQAFALGMLMTQLIDPERFTAFPYLWTGGAPEGERLRDWVAREWSKQPHVGETPPGVAREAVESASRALEAIDAARPHVTRNREEFERLANDVRCILALMRHYELKTRAAALVLRYGYSRDAADLNSVLPLLRDSVKEYRKLVRLTGSAYRQAASVHSPSRRIPFLGRPGKYVHWRDCLPEYEAELARFERNIQIAATAGSRPPTTISPLSRVRVLSVAPGAEAFEVRPGAKLYIDRDTLISDVAPELRGQTGIRIAAENPTPKINFETAEPSQVLVGFFRSSKKGAAASPPKDEWEPVLWNGIAAANHPGFSVYSHALPAGKNELALGPGTYVILGFVRQTAPLQPRIVFFEGSASKDRPYLDWLFE